MTFLDILLGIFGFLFGPFVIGVLTICAMITFGGINADVSSERSDIANVFWWGLFAIMVPIVVAFIIWLILTYGIGYNWIPAVDRNDGWSSFT